MNIITLNRVLLNNTPLNYRRKRILTEKDFYFKTIERTFTFSKSAGGKSIKDGRAYIKRIKGNSVVWNQGIENVLSSSTSVRAWIPRRGLDYASIENGEITLRFDSQSDAFGNSIRQRINAKAGDKFFISYDYESHNVDQFGRRMFIAFTAGWSSRGGLNDNCTAKGGDVTGHVEAIDVVSSYSDIDSLCIFFCYTGITSPDTTPLKVSNFRFVNLTKEFGAEEAAKINTIEDYNARKPFVEDEYAYNAGQVIHCNTESIKSVGDNAWDEEWESGTITEAGGIDYPSASYSRTRGYVKVIGGEQYAITSPSQKIVYLYYYDGNKNYTLHKYVNATLNGDIVTIPSNCQYMRFTFSGTTYNNDIMISLVHSGWKQDTDAGYQPYWQDTLPLPIIRKYFPDGMKSAGSAHDEIRFNKTSGKWEKVVRIEQRVFTSAIKIERVNSEGIINAILVDHTADYNGKMGNVIGFEKQTSGIADTTSEGWFISGDDTKMNALYLRLSTVTLGGSTITEVNAYLAKNPLTVLLVYADPIVTELDAEDQNFRDYYNVADFGTEMSQSSVPSAALLADVGYYFKKSEVKELTLN